MANRTIRTTEKETLLLEALRERPVFSSACRKARVSRVAFYEWRRDDPAFDANVLAARQQGLDAIEDALHQRALKNDTTAGIFLLKSLRRDVYGDRVDHRHAGSIRHDHRHWTVEQLTDAEIEALLPIAERVMQRQEVAP